MTNEEKRCLATARELELLRETVRNFDQVVADAQRLANECRSSLERLESIERPARADAAIARLERLHAARRIRSDSLSDNLVDITRTLGGL